MRSEAWRAGAPGCSLSSAEGRRERALCSAEGRRARRWAEGGRSAEDGRERRACSAEDGREPSAEVGRERELVPVPEAGTAMMLAQSTE